MVTEFWNGKPGAGINCLSLSFSFLNADGNADEIIDDLDLQNSWNLQAGETGYKTGDFNLDTQVDNKDKDDIWVPNEGKGRQVPN